MGRTGYKRPGTFSSQIPLTVIIQRSFVDSMVGIVAVNEDVNDEQVADLKQDMAVELVVSVE